MRFMKAFVFTRYGSQPLIEFIATQINTGKFKAVIDRVYSMDDIADAYRFVEAEQKVGIVVVNIASEIKD